MLHVQRLAAPERARPADLPEGAMFAWNGRFLLKLGAVARPWSWTGYGAPEPLPDASVATLTPAATRAALRAGYRPRLHPSVASAE